MTDTMMDRVEAYFDSLPQPIDPAKVAAHVVIGKGAKADAPLNRAGKSQGGTDIFEGHLDEVETPWGIGTVRVKAWSTDGQPSGTFYLDPARRGEVLDNGYALSEITVSGDRKAVVWTWRDPQTPTNLVKFALPTACNVETLTLA